VGDIPTVLRGVRQDSTSAAGSVPGFRDTAQTKKLSAMSKCD
jgi:hypothetical protein